MYRLVTGDIGASWDTIYKIQKCINVNEQRKRVETWKTNEVAKMKKTITSRTYVRTWMYSNVMLIKYSAL